MHTRRLLGGLAVALVLAAGPAPATTMVEPMTLDEVTAEAKHVVHAVVTSVTSGRDENGVPSTWTTFQVAETLKGAHEASVTIKQYGVAEPLPDGTLTRLAGLPTYELGEEVVVFLRSASRRGFTSPVGLGQGAYRVKRKGGKSEVRNDDDQEGSQDLSTFVKKVKTRVQKQK